MISKDIKTLINVLEGQTLDFLKRHKGKLVLGSLGLAGTAAGLVGYNKDSEFANDIDLIKYSLTKPIIKAARHIGLVKDSLISNSATDKADEGAAYLRDIARGKVKL